MARYDPLPYVREARPRNLRLADLYLRQGEQQAEAERRRGDISAQMWGNLGNAVGQTGAAIVQAPQQERDRKAKEAEQAQIAESRGLQLSDQRRQVNDRENFDLAMGAGSREKTLAALKDRPELYEKAQSHFNNIDTSMKKLLGDTAAGIADFGYTPEAAMAAMDDLMEQGFDERKIEPFRQAIQQDPAHVKRLVDSLLSQSPDPRHQAMAKPQALVELNKDTSLYDPNTREVVASGPKSPAPREPNPTEASLAMAAAAGDPAAKQALALMRAQRPPSGSAGPRPLTQTAEAQIIQRLSNQWATANKPMKELDRQIELMNAGMKAVDRGDRAQGDQAILVTFQKILDPPSVVRESEYMRSAAGQSLMSRVQGAFQQLRAGGAGMKPEELRKFATLAREAAAAQRKAANIDGIQQRLKMTGDRYGIPSELIFDATPADSTPGPSEPLQVGPFTVKVKSK